MSSSASRPPPPRRGKEQAREPEPAPEPARTGDLFEHFGVELERPPEQLAAIVAGRACPGCGWLVGTDEAGPCPLCGEAGSTPPR